MSRSFLLELERDETAQRAESMKENMKIEALCAAPPEAAYPQPEPNATELPSSAPGRPKLVELEASAPSPTPTRTEEHIASAPSPAAVRRRELHTPPAGVREEHCT